MIRRYMLCGFYADKSYKINKNNYNASLAFFEDKVFLYFETDNDKDYRKIAEKITDINLYTLPNGEKWIEMTDIFHYSYPANSEYWERKIQNKKPVFKIVYLKPEGVGQYIFYHYKFQREATCDFDKYGVIFILQNMLVMYYEEPNEPADLSLVKDKWKKIIPDYEGDIIADWSLEWKDDNSKRWRECELA